MPRILLLGLVALVIVLCASGPANGQDDAKAAMQARIDKTKTLMEKARKEGNWEDFIQLQKKLADLHAEFEKLDRGERGEGERDEHLDRDLREWASNLKKRLASLEDEQRIEILKRIAAELREQGDPEKFGIVAEMLKRHPGVEKGDGAKKALKELDKAIKKQRKEIEKAEDNFEFEKADALRAELGKLMQKRESVLREVEESGRKGEVDMETRLRALFEKLLRARNEGDKKLVEKIEREIQEIKRGGAPTRESDWKAEAHAVVEKAIGQFKEWIQDALESDDGETAGELEEGIAHMKELWEAIERVSTPEERIEISKNLSEAMEELAADVRKLREQGEPRKAKMVDWTGEQLRRVHQILISGGAPAHPAHEKAAGIVAEIAEKMEAWLHEAEQGGNGEKAERFRNDIRNVRRFQELLKSGLGPEVMEKLSLALNEGIEKIRKEIEVARMDGDVGKVRMLDWVASKMGEAREVLGKGLHPERGKEEWRTECLETAGDVASRLERWLDQAREQGDEKAIMELEKSLRGVSEFREALRFAGSPEIREHLLPLVEKGLDLIMENAAKARDRGEWPAVEFLEWTGGKLEHVREILRNAAAGGTERPDPGLRERLMKSREEIARIQTEAEELEAQGQYDKADLMRRKADELKRRLMNEMREAGPRRGPEGGEPGPQFGPGRRGPGGQERGQFGRRMRELTEEMRKAEERGDQDRLKELRGQMDDLRREMDSRRGDQPRPPQAGPQPGPERQDKDAEKLRKEIDSLRKELQELKKLLKELLKEKD